MFRKKSRNSTDGGESGLARHYSLDWPASQRWNPRYDVPRNSVEDTLPPGELPSEPVSSSPDSGDRASHHKRHPGSTPYGRSTRDLDTYFDEAQQWRAKEHDEADNEFSSLAHWLDALSEMYMNTLDNRARWDPRWFNITRRERFEGLTSVRMSVLDYYDDEATPRSTSVKTKQQLATTMQERPEAVRVRVVMVSDLSRFVMGALGYLCSVDPEFWFEHLVQSGYSASDSGLKVKNAAWLNWAERETRFRHQALPGVGQRTEWNAPRRAKGRNWAHLRWGRLGVLNYLGRKGFYEDEISKRVGDGRWLMERDVLLNKHGLLMTASRKARAEQQARKRSREKKGKSAQPTAAAVDDTSARYKTANVYRPYSTFGPLPRNPKPWTNRDLRVMAPEGLSYLSGNDADGKKTVIIVVDPARSMKHSKTKEVTPSLTFMPRALEWEAYDNERRWMYPEPGETFLDPPPPPVLKKDVKMQKKETAKRRLKDGKVKLRGKLGKDAAAEGHDKDGQVSNPEDKPESSFTSDSEYSQDYDDELRAEYKNPKEYVRFRDFARKYAWSTFELLQHGLTRISTAEMLEGESVIPPLLTRVCLDDLWQLLAEMRLGLDHIDTDLSGDWHLLLSVGAKMHQNVQNVVWMRSSLREIYEWAKHMASVPKLKHPEEISDELATVIQEVEVLQARTDSTTNLLGSLTGLAQSSLVIDQTSGINKLTELAFFFVPLSFITAVFSMQVLEFSTAPPPIWVWGLTLSVVFLIVYLVRITLRSPSVRSFANTCRATILNRFTPSSASRQLNSIGNIAIAKFLLFFTLICCYFIGLVCLALTLFFLIFGGLWVGAAATALYFVITRWPEPAVLVPGFVSLVLAAVGLWASWHWREVFNKVAEDWMLTSTYWLKGALPSGWTMDRVDDEDLAKEGINTYARQAIVLATS